MHRALSARWLSRALRVGETPTSTRVPLFLCPAISSSSLNAVSRRAPALAQRRELHVEPGAWVEEPPPEKPTKTTEWRTDDTTAELSPETTPSTLLGPRKLPITCTGCGAFSQTDDPKQFGFYNLENKRTRKWLNASVPKGDRPVKDEEQVVNQALQSMTPEQLEALGLDPATMLHGELPDQEPPKINSPAPKSIVCDRCHTLEHNSYSTIPMFHPTVESLRATIEESPHKYNHIYHVIDAADFPMSLVPRLNVLLGDIRLRKKNRRARKKFIDDRMTEMTFVITRADLLGPTKESVDRMMPYLQAELRAALGRLGEKVRLGNVVCVSARRGWWTKSLKETIWERGGAAWMVGKVNVGKSQLFEAIYPKGRIEDAKSWKKNSGYDVSLYPREGNPYAEAQRDLDKGVGDLLPPLQPLQQYPDMPMVSAHPGTTASPIRIPFGNKKGELVDLPGLSRCDLEHWVRPEHRKSLIMQNRIVPEQRSCPAAKSLVLGGGLIRITPASQNLHFLMYNFTPLHDHLTSTPKAIAMQNQVRGDKADAWTPGLENIAVEGTNHKMHHAGRFELKTDVSKLRAGPLTRKDSVNLTVDKLPFRVLSVDILIEGVGYVEIVCQVRRAYLEHSRKNKLHWAAKSIENHDRRIEDKERTTTDQLQADVRKGDPFAQLTVLRHKDNMEDPQKPPEDSDKMKRFHVFSHAQIEPDWPAVDVFSPTGKFVDSRAPIQGWMRNKPLVKPEHRRARPRPSAKGWKKKEKKEKRAISQVLLDTVFKARRLE